MSWQQFPGPSIATGFSDRLAGWELHKIPDFSWRAIRADTDLRNTTIVAVEALGPTAPNGPPPTRRCARPWRRCRPGPRRSWRTRTCRPGETICTEQPPPGRRWVPQSAESPTKDQSDPKLAAPGLPDRFAEGQLAARAVNPWNKASTTSTLPPTYWKWSPGRRGILDPRNGH